MTLPPLPAFAVTGVGSLPGTDVEAAVDRVLAHAPDLPYAPQLPNRSPRERLVPQAAEGLPGIRIEDRHGWAFVEGISIPGTGTVPDVGEPVVSDEAYSGLFRLLDRVKGSDRAVKVQIAGPVTTASHVTDGRGRRAIYDPGWRRAAARGIGAKAAHLAALVRDAGCDPVVFLDEPSLVAAGAQAALTPGGAAALVAEALEAIDAPRGVHCCARVDWDLLFGLPVDAIAFDAYAFGEEAVASGAIGRFVVGGGAVLWGIVPASGAALEETPSGLVARLRHHLGQVAAAGPGPDRAAAASMLTTSCGLGTVTEAVADRALKLLGQVAAGMAAV